MNILQKKKNALKLDQKKFLIAPFMSKTIIVT